MTITQVHQPALQEGACAVCTAEYRANADAFLNVAWAQGPTIDAALCRRFKDFHGLGHRWFGTPEVLSVSTNAEGDVTGSTISYTVNDDLMWEVLSR